MQSFRNFDFQLLEVSFLIFSSTTSYNAIIFVLKFNMKIACAEQFLIIFSDEKLLIIENLLLAYKIDFFMI
jgi:hypothetical protein